MARNNSTRSVTAQFRFFFPLSVWLSAEPAALFDALLVRLSRSVFDAAVAAFLPVVSLGGFLSVKALPADARDS